MAPRDALTMCVGGADIDEELSDNLSWRFQNRKLRQNPFER